ncbi:hypothetical protein AVEN_188684-1 [Araneus ventricosus]|uniref:Integrase catalytic domain-containing protein n=1 Tax=Araneus ventricosus TaxID=182803 RepID=A0A4Y2DAC2_ARAVE|nr:hypothetical protein AVEN_188684-1 [Araneus ventricosus]
MHPSASLRGSRENAPIEFPQSGEKGAVWPFLVLQHIVYNSDAVDVQIETARTRSCGRRLTCIDRFTCWIEVIPLANVTAEIVAREFYDHWISRFEMPYSVITGQDSQFRSELFKNICGFKVCTTTAYHSQCNGKI